MKRLILIIIVLFTCSISYAQNNSEEKNIHSTELFVFAGLHQYFPFSHSLLARTIMPLWYDFSRNELEIGGQSIGVELHRYINEKSLYIGQLQFKNQRFSLGNLGITDENGNPIGEVLVTNQDFAIRHSSLYGRKINNSILGIGLGADLYLASYIYYDRPIIEGQSTQVDNNYRLFSPLVSGLFIQQFNKWSLSTQVDYAFLSRNKDVNFRRSTYMSITVGANFRIK